MNVICYATAIVLAVVLAALIYIRELDNAGRGIDDDRDLP